MAAASTGRARAFWKVGSTAGADSMDGILLTVSFTFFTEKPPEILFQISREILLYFPSLSYCGVFLYTTV